MMMKYWFQFSKDNERSAVQLGWLWVQIQVKREGPDLCI